MDKISFKKVYNGEALSFSKAELSRLNLKKDERIEILIQVDRPEAYKVLLNLVVKLTGSPVRFTESSDKGWVEEVLLRDVFGSEDKGGIEFGWTRFNELLLICNKDRITKDFFDFFFKEKLNITKETLDVKMLQQGIEQFRKFAMLAYGNFRFAYRELSKCSKDEIKQKLRPFLKQPDKTIKELKSRSRKLKGITQIEKAEAYFLGYLSSDDIEKDYRLIVDLERCLNDFKGDDINKFMDSISPDLHEMIVIYRDNNKHKSLEHLKQSISDARSSILGIKQRFQEVRSIGEQNTDVYLTWDYMDVYVATSMRERWDYESLHEFVKNLFQKPTVKDLNLRYFDPTQSFERNRVDKGLIEGLMLKRANCTIYAVQETDTLGKDSELAATLAQGKPVIAYIPKIQNIESHINNVLSNLTIEALRDKFRLLSRILEKSNVQNECLEKIKRFRNNQRELVNFLNKIDEEIESFLNKKIWRLLPTPWAIDDEFKKEKKRDIEDFYKILAIADKHFYDKRHDDLKHRHPLGIQMNLSTGVANGVLVVRKIETCAELLLNIITNQLDFDIIYDQDLKCWYLKEKLTQSIFRVVTDDLKLTNSFWNFYLLEE